jgi:hypothetical protein
MPDRQPADLKAEFERHLERWIGRLGEPAVTEVTQAVLRKYRRRGHPPIDDELIISEMHGLLLRDKTLTPWNAAARLAKGNTENYRLSVQKRLFKKFDTSLRKFLEIYGEEKPRLDRLRSLLSELVMVFNTELAELESEEPANVTALHRRARALLTAIRSLHAEIGPERMAAIRSWEPKSVRLFREIND